jgi:uncharacterized Tic20 family protein
MSEDTPNSNDETNKWAGGVHVAAFLLALFTSWSAGIGGMIAAMVVWVVKKDESAFIRRHAAEAFNFNFTMFLFTLVAVFFTLFTLGIGLIFVIPLAVVLAVVWLWCTIQAAIAGFDGKEYRYPLSFRIMN